MQFSNTSDLPEALYTGTQCRDIDRRVIDSGAVSGYELMTRAGQFAFGCLKAKLPGANSIAVFCGSGNNGGDGYVIAALAKQSAYKVKVYAEKAPATDDARTAREFALQQDCEIIQDSENIDLTVELMSVDVIVDALLGTGVDRPITGHLASLVSFINNSNVPVLSCDVPTGLNSDTGTVMGCCVKASVTTSFIAMKKGLFTADAKTHCGEIKFSDLQVDSKFYEDSESITKLINQTNLKKNISLRYENAHKGTTGFVAVIGGAPGMMGAVLMAGKAAYRTGAGRVKVLTCPDHSSVLALSCPELLTQGIGTENAWQFDRFQAMAIGPGLGMDEWARKIFNQTLQSKVPMVLDADALNLLALENVRRDHWILTPHPGEAARLLNCSVNDIQCNRFEAAAQIVKQYGGVCVLKGSGSLVAGQDRVTRVCNAGNSGQATAGMGDVLTGCIVSLVAQGYELFESACLGTWLHSAAADHCAAQRGKVGIMATDLFANIQALHNQLHAR